MIGKNHQPERKTEPGYLTLKVRGVEHDAHKHTSEGPSDGNGHDPGEDEETDSLPVNGLESAVAETDTDGGASDTHGSRDRERELREYKDGDSRTHLHGRATARGVVGDLVAHDCRTRLVRVSPYAIGEDLPFMMLYP